MKEVPALKLQISLSFLLSFGLNQSIAEQWGGPPLHPMFELVVI